MLVIWPCSTQDGNGVEDDVTQEARSQDSEERSSASFGPVTSPFFFMCQYPRQGEASGVEGQDDLSVKVEFVGSNRPDQGYQPHTVYEGEFLKLSNFIAIINAVGCFFIVIVNAVGCFLLPL